MYVYVVHKKNDDAIQNYGLTAYLIRITHKNEQTQI